MDVRFLFFVTVIAVLPAGAQPAQINCTGQTCTFNLSFDDGYSNLTNITGAAYSGQQNHLSARTLPNGTNTATPSNGPMIYRDSKGRVRTEQHAYPAGAPGRPVPPDDFVIAEIHDPVAGFEFVLDPVSKVAHRIAFKSDGQWKWDPARVTSGSAIPSGPNSTTEFLGTRTISGVTAYGHKTTSNRIRPDGTAISMTDEEWLAPATGAVLLRINTNLAGAMTLTVPNYSEAEPDPGLFQIPEGYKTVDETGPFQVVHEHTGPGVSSMGQHGPQLTGSCDEGVCTIAFDPGTIPVNAAITGAPYSGHETIMSMSTNPADNLPPTSRTRNGTWRDSAGRLRTDPAPFNNGGRGGTVQSENQLPSLVEIQDPVAGFLYILNPASQTAYRIQATSRAFAFQPVPMQPTGTRTAPNGRTDLIENIGPETISGVTATGQRTTTTYPPGSYNQNDKELVTVSERWIDPKTGITILTKNSGQLMRFANTTSIADYKEGDPDASLFQVPAGYKTIEESGAFTFTTPAR